MSAYYEDYDSGVPRRKDGAAYRGYDVDYGYRNGIGLGSRWAHRRGDPGWSSGGRRVGGWTLDLLRQARERPVRGARSDHERLYTRGPFGFDRGDPRGDRRFFAHDRSAWHRQNSWGRPPAPYDTPFRRYAAYDRDYHGEY